jgi:GGDEF domain-containing protein
MYKMEHPYAVDAVREFYGDLSEGLHSSTPIVLIMNHDHFFIDEEPFDSRLNTSRMSAHFKNAAIESISFEDGVSESEIECFFGVFCDQKKYPNADAIKAQISASGVVNIKINYVFFKKMTSDDEIVLKADRESDKKNPREQMYKEVLNRITEDFVLEELEKSISLKSLVENPTKVSDQLIESDLKNYKSEKTPHAGPGTIIARQLDGLKEELDQYENGVLELDLADLARAVFDMKAHLLAKIEEQKALGVIYYNEEQILDEANDISDRVIIQLVREEYKKGEISIQRLAHILRRLIPDAKELQRLLPKLKEAMLAEGMSTSDFVELVKEIAKEMQSDEISEVLKQGAEKIGLDGDELIRNLKIDPEGAAELIYLASEIRNGAGDEKVLSELLVEFVERVGSKLTIKIPDGENKESSVLHEFILNLGSKIVNKLKMKDVDSDVLTAVEKRLRGRIDKFLQKLETNLIPHADVPVAEKEFGNTSVFRMLEESVGEGDDLQKILAKVRRGIDEGSIDENNFQQVHDEIVKIKAEQLKENIKGSLPQGILNYVNTLVYIEKEINRSLRYDTPFSSITFSVFDLRPQKPVPTGSISGNDISYSVMGELVSILRGADIVGILNKKTIVVLLPMTNEKNAKIALKRLLIKLHESPFIINNIPIVVKFAGAVTSFDPESTSDLKTFLAAAENSHNEMLVRLRNVQSLM